MDLDDDDESAKPSKKLKFAATAPKRKTETLRRSNWRRIRSALSSRDAASSFFRYTHLRSRIAFENFEWQKGYDHIPKVDRSPKPKSRNNMSTFVNLHNLQKSSGNGNRWFFHQVK